MTGLCRSLPALRPGCRSLKGKAAGDIRCYVIYATPWPLSGDDYPCPHEPAARNHDTCWMDRYGNKELI